MQHDVKNLRVLLCDPEGLTLMALRKALTRAGYVPIAEEVDIQKAVALVGLLLPDFVIMDMGHPGALSGLEATRQIAAQATLPVLILSAYGDADHRKAVFASGASGYLEKPFTSEQLLTAVEETLTRFHRRSV